MPAAAATKVASKAMPATTPATGAAKAATETKKKSAASTKKPAAGVLSEAELLRMPEKDYMNAAQLEFFRHRLMTMKEEILVNARETGEHLKENEVFADPNDRATVEEENMLEQRVRDRERKLLKKIDSALRRIEAGEYGYCLETGDPIGIARLLARPTAELSIEAQEKHERLEKLFAD
jgi:DnaK suppressor protein